MDGPAFRHDADLPWPPSSRGLFVALAFIAGGLDAKGSFDAGCATAAVGLTFLAVGLSAAQLMRTSRGANGVAAAAVTAAYVIRRIGDALGTPSADHLLMTVAWWSWASPIGWGQQALAYDANTLTPLLLNRALTLAFLSLVFLLQGPTPQAKQLVTAPPRPPAGWRKWRASTDSWMHGFPNS